MPDFYKKVFPVAPLRRCASQNEEYSRCAVASLRETKQEYSRCAVASLRDLKEVIPFAPLRRCASQNEEYSLCAVASLREIKQEILNSCAKYLLIFNHLYNFLSEIFAKSLVIWVPKTYLCVPLIKRRSILSILKFYCCEYIEL